MNKLWTTMIVIMLLVLLLPSMGKAYSVINAQPLLLDMAAQQPDKQVSVIVQKTGKDNSVEQAIQNMGGVVTKDLHIINGFAAQLLARQIPSLSELSGIRFISLDAPAESSATTCTGCVDIDSLISNYNKEINADKVWNKSVNGVQMPWLQGQGVTVAVVDSGIQTQNDFKSTVTNKPRILKEVSMLKNVTPNGDAYGHGTHVAGIIGGSGINSKGGYVGIAPQVNLVSVKVSSETGAVSASDVISGLQWVNDNRINYNIKVVNLSLNSVASSSYNYDPLNAAAEILWFNKVVVVVSAGNNGTANLYAPANDPFVITVGAVDDNTTLDRNDDKIASFSAWGNDETGQMKPDLVAPARKTVSVLASGGETLSKLHPNYRLSSGLSGAYFIMSGTSMAAPVVSGAVALLLQSEPNLTPDQVKYRLKATALQNTARGEWDTRTGWSGFDPLKAGAGYLDIQAAIAQKSITGSANNGLPASKLLWSGNTPLNWSSVNWSSVNWSSVNWSSVNWSSVNWSSVNWSSVNWSSDFWDD